MTIKKKKIIFSATIAGVTLFTIYKVTKSNEKKYAEVKTNNDSDSDEKMSVEKNINFRETCDKVKVKISAYVHKFVEYMVTHQSEIDTLKSTILLIASLFTLKSAVGKTGVNKSSEMLPCNSSFKSIDVKSGDVLVGEWDNAGQYLHFSVV